jgi:hypothetical protein
MYLYALPLLTIIDVQRHPQYNSKYLFKMNLVNAARTMLPSTGVSSIMPLGLTPAPNRNEAVTTI